MALGPEIIFKMREMFGERAEAAEKKFSKAANLSVIDQYESGVFTVCVVMSGEKLYEVIRFFDFVFCPCGDFEFSGPCKHAWCAMPKICRKCRKWDVKNIGDTCQACTMKSAPYLKQTAEKKLEKIGSIPI